MIQKSFTKNYFKIYTTQFLSILINVLSLVIVIPYLANTPKVYGIYTLCISFTIFLSYSDLGFLNAGYKYASEYYAKNNSKKEIEIIGFVSFILLIFTAIFAIAITILAFHPTWLIKDISENQDISIARDLLLILAFFSPNTLMQRILQIIYGIRVQEYILQKILIVINLLKIGSVYFFINNGVCNIVGYFLFCQSIATLGLLTGVFLAKRKYSISLKFLISNIRFSKEVYNSIKALAFGSLYITIAWLLFYEFDPYVIAKLSGADAVALYSIGLICLAFFRSVFGALFGPFNARFNHFIADNDYSGLTNLTKTVLCVLLPAVVFPTLSLALLSKPFVFTWVGDKFQQSAKIVTLLALCNICAFINYPAAILAIATKKIKFIYIISSVQLIVYWTGIAIFFSTYGYIVFAYFELICFSVTSILYTWFMCSFLKVNIFKFIKTIIAPAVLPVIFLILILLLIRGYFPETKSKLYLFEVVATGIITGLLSLALYYFTSAVFKNYINQLLLKLKHPFITNLGKGIFSNRL